MRRTAALMVRALGKSVLLACLIAAGAVAYLYFDRNSVDHRLAIEEEKNRQLELVVQRMQTDRRVAEILVTDQKTVNGQLKTTLLFVEYAADGSDLPARYFTIDGNEAHFDAQIVKFKDQYVRDNDPLRNHSIILLLRVYGADQAPQDAFPIDVPGKIPDAYRGVDPAAVAFEQELWNNFWNLYNDKAARDAKGIRGLHGEGLWGKFDRDHIYTITIRADGGTILEEPIKPIYREALHRQ